MYINLCLVCILIFYNAGNKKIKSATKEYTFLRKYNTYKLQSTGFNL